MTISNPRRVHSHAAAALINFCEGVEHDTLIPYLDPIVERLLRLLNPDGDESQVHSYVREQAITTLAMVADASESTFAKHYPTIMPLLLNVLRNAEKPQHQRLRIKAMECAGLVGTSPNYSALLDAHSFAAIAVGRDVFRPDSATLIELLLRIQSASSSLLNVNAFSFFFRESRGSQRYSTHILSYLNLGQNRSSARNRV